MTVNSQVLMTLSRNYLPVKAASLVSQTETLTLRTPGSSQRWPLPR
jgi:hypothetical protein